MSFQLIVSNSLKSLADSLSQKIQTETSVFQPIYVVTQTEGMNAWLRLQIAEKLGIAANIQFLKPNDIINLIYKNLGGNYIQSISTHDMNWLLYKLLGEKEFIEKYPNISSYYEFAGIDKDIKRMALAEEIADLFDQYQVYRTEMIEQWNRGEGEDHWQKDLWIKAREIASNDFPDKTMVGKYILENLNDSNKVKFLQNKIPNIYFFGLSLMTHYHLQIFYSIAQHIDLYFLMQNPAPNDYWYEDKSEKVIDYLKRKDIIPETEKSVSNPLLTNWGKLIQDTFMMMFENEESLNNYQEVETIEPPKDTLLHSIQNSIYNNEKEEIEFSMDQIYDGSIQINSCFSPVREVEALYNYLVHLVDQKNESLSARDIVVMVSDIDLYASYIRAVFDNGPYYFRYSIADESYVVSDTISNTLVEILSLSESQFTSEKVMNLLNFSAIKKQFQIYDDMKMRDLVAQANIKFGIKGDKNDQTHYVSWKYGMNRMMYGLCMSEAMEYGSGEDSFFPLDSVEGYDMFEVVRFVNFVQTLIDSIEKRKRKRTITEWVEYVEETLTTFIGINEEVQDEDYAVLLNHLERYNVLQDLFDEKVSFEVFQHSFLPTIKDAKKSGQFASGGITFCSLIPMRSIPFKVVGLLGMNFDKFPRIDKRQSFDLMLKERKRGDRNVKDNDKHLFLETIISAQDYLYISYIGQSVKDNSTLPPSALIDELIDFISVRSENPDFVRENFIQNHPLHGFSKKYNSTNEKLYSYLLDYPKKLSDFTSDTKQKTLEFDFGEIEIGRFVKFLQDPISEYYKRVLNVYYREEDYKLEETEVFELNNLEKWFLKNELLKAETIDDLKNKQLKTGKLPLKNIGEFILQNQLEEIEFTKEKIQELTDNFPERNLLIELEIDNSLIVGNLSKIFGERMIRYTFSSNEEKYVLEAYIHYLLARAQGEKIEFYFIFNAEQKVFSAKDITQSEALEELNELMKIYKKGHFELLPFSLGLVNFNTNKEIDLLYVKSEIKNYFGNPKYSFNNQYHIKEKENGLFDQADFYENYMNLAKKLIIRPFQTICPEKLNF